MFLIRRAGLRASRSSSAAYPLAADPVVVLVLRQTAPGLADSVRRHPLLHRPLYRRPLPFPRGRLTVTAQGCSPDLSSTPRSARSRPLTQ